MSACSFSQAIGFGLLHYPIDTNTILWGFAIGAAALVATATSAAVLRTLRQHRTPLALAVTLIGAYAAYELALLAATPFLGGAEAFTAAIVIRLGSISAVWLIGLVAACEIVRLVVPVRRGQAVS